MLLKMDRRQYHKHMTNTLSLYREFDQAIEYLKTLAREFGPGSDELFNAQMMKCQGMRLRLVQAENLEDLDENGDLTE